MNNNNLNRGYVSFTGLLFITFLVLKLTKVIDWSWWWITAPLWGPFALSIVFMILYIIVGLIMVILKRRI